MVCGLSAAESLMNTDAVRRPVPVGAKLTVMVQVSPAAIDAPQSFDMIKSPLKFPDGTMPLKVAGAVPTLLTTTDCAALVVPMVWVLKLRLGTDK